jgi:hypothetical protein
VKRALLDGLRRPQDRRPRWRRVAQAGSGSQVIGGEPHGWEVAVDSSALLDVSCAGG